jgi:two-component system KDP operon response regulator KdpE
MLKSQNLRILIVDDEKSIRRFLKVSLVSYGYDVFEAETGNEALEKSVTSHPDVIILDLALPDIDGIAVISKIRNRTKVPIIVLSVREDISDKVKALDMGADDYLTKPFNVIELLARLKTVMRRLLPSNQEEIIKIGKLSMDIAKHQVIVNGNEVDVTPTEYNILKFLILNADKVLTHKQILQEVWDKSENLEGVLHLLRVTISNLRSKLEPNPDRPTYILTEPGIGYRLSTNN